MPNANAFKDLGRIRYIEPTNIFQKQEGTLSDSISFPYEDYCMAVDLSIRVTDRYSCGFALETHEYTDYSYSSDKGTISFLGGTRLGDNSFLTTNFTDVSMTTPSGNTSECLGIESISITYNSWMYPQVVIKFVDVRGATVMSPNENGYYNPQDMGMSSTIYKSFFTFPYPIYTLKVKGFYGKGVTYKLAVEKTSIEMDSNTGNFNITVSFIGYMFGIYADMPMSYVAIAPFTNEGREYWNRKVSDGTFSFKDVVGNKTAPMMTIPELREALSNAAENEEAISAAKEGEKIVNNIDEQIATLEDIRDTFPLREWFETDSVDYVYKLESTNTNMDDFRFSVSGFLSTVSNYDETYGTSFMNNFPALYEFAVGNAEINSVYLIVSGGSATYTDSVRSGENNNKDLYNEYIMPYDDVLQYIEANRANYKTFYLYFLPKIEGQSSYKNFINSISNEISRLMTEKNNTQKEYEQIKESIIEKVLGFRPSVRNIYEMVFAHMDTFMHVFYSMTRRIKDQLDSNKIMRDKTFYGVADGETDTERTKIGSSNESRQTTVPRGKYLPPFPAFYRTDRDGSGNGIERKVMRWPGELLNGYKLEETKFIDDFLSASQLYNNTNSDVDERINMNVSSSGNTGGRNNKQAPSSDIIKGIPLTTYDFIKKDDIANPYDGLKTKIFRGEDGIDGEIIGKFALRALYYLSANEIESKNAAKAFGTIEAINLFKSIGDKYSYEFLKFIKNYKNSSEDYDFISKVTSTRADNTTQVWRDDAADNITNILLAGDSSSDELRYYYHMGISYSEDELTSVGEGVNAMHYVTSTLDGTAIGEHSYYVTPNSNYILFPLEFSTFDDLKKSYVFDKGGDASGGKKYGLLNDDSFITVTNMDSVGYSETNPKTTFYLYESRDFIKNIFDNVETEIKNQEILMEQVSENENYVSRGQDEYGEIKKSNKILRKYKKIIDEDFGERSYAKFAIVDKDEKQINYKKLKNLIANATKEEQERYFIKYPSIVNEDKEVTVFDTDIYKAQTDVKSKAFIFLQSIPIRGGNAGVETENQNGIALKSKLLREGALWWWKSNPGAVNIPSGYKEPKPEDNETFIGVTSNPSKRAADTIRLITDRFSDRKAYYLKWSAPEGTTPSRKRELIKYFEEWATSKDSTGFAANEERLRNINLYKTKYDEHPRISISENERIYAKGLDISGLVVNGNLENSNVVEAIALQAFLRNIFFTVCTTFDLYNGLHGDNGTALTCSRDSMVNAFNGFINELENIYLQSDRETVSGTTLEVDDTYNPFKNNDLRLSTYITMKSLYDKWLCSPYNGPECTWKLKGEYNPDLNSKQSDFDSFVYVDTFYHDIGYQLLVNVSKISQWLSVCLPTSNIGATEGSKYYPGSSVFEFLTQVAVDCGAILLALPNRFGLSKPQSVKEMFTPLSINSEWNNDSSSFVFMYSYKPSEHLGDDDTSNIDMNGWNPEGDGFDLTNDEIIGKLFTDEGYSIPAFGVTYGKQNQSIFKDIRLSTENAGVTEAGINATMNIISKASESPRETVLYGQDLYRIYSQYSYGCTVRCMGNMEIMPLMYFQLNNTPLWKGAYMIKKVSHTISAGNIDTEFEGVRLNKYMIPISDGAVIINKDSGNHGDADKSSRLNNEFDENIDVDNGRSDTNPHTGYTISDPIDFDEKNVSPNKPIICLLPAHGPATEKYREWEWSSLLVDEIKNELSGYKFKDGTSYKKNIQTCNKNGNHTTSNGYNTQEIENLIYKYGSNQVISVSPHWNGGSGSYHMVMVDKETNGVRLDSNKLAECLQGEMEKLRGVRGEYSEMPLGMMDGDCKIVEESERNTDKAPQLNCACVLTENWFADYPSGCPWRIDESPSSDPSDWYAGKDNNNRFKSGRGWLMSDTGLKTIAQAHAKGIKRYIDSL